VATIELGGITAEVVRKEIKHIHLVVYPPDGRVRITAPQRYKLDMLRVCAINKLGWIQTQRR
jgi:predicted metal-dependent hydrolase